MARVHVNRWGDSSAHLHMWFLARPKGQLQLRGTFLSLWDGILPPVPEAQWRENLAMVAAWLEQFGGTALAEPPHIEWQAPSSLTPQQKPQTAAPVVAAVAEDNEPNSVALAEAPDEEQSDEAPKAEPAAVAVAEEKPEAPGEDVAEANGKPEPKAQGGDDKDKPKSAVAAGHPVAT